MGDGPRQPAPTLILEGGLVLTLDGGPGSGRLDVGVGGGRIGALAPAGSLAPRHPGAEVVDCRRRVILPGLVNAHLHPELQAAKGLLEELGLHQWSTSRPFEEALRFLSSAAGAEVRRLAVRAALAECLLGGTTCVGTYGVTAGAERVAAEELHRLGLRGHVTVRDLDFAPVTDLGAPHVFRLHAEEALTVAELEAAAAAHERGEWIVMHVAETYARRRLAERRFGATPIRLLARYGLLSPRVLLSHAVHVDAGEMALIADSGAPVLASPSAEMKLADGIAPVVELLGRGVRVAIGTDAAVCNNGNDLLLELRQLGLLQKLRYGASAVGALRILEIGTRGGGVIPGAPPGHGRVAPGAPADLALLDASSPRLQPLLHADGFSNVAANVVFACTAADVSDVLIGGEWRVRDGALPGLDADALWDDLAQAGQTLHEHVSRA